MVSVTSFIILFVFWIIWSGKFDAFHLVLGVISSLIVTLWSRDLLISEKNNIPFKWNEKFPINSLYLMRGFLFIDENKKEKFIEFN